MLYASGEETTRTVQRWSEEAYETLQDCFEMTDWQVLCKLHGEDIDGLTECIMDYITFCVDSLAPTRNFHCYSNNKPWVTREIKVIVNEKKRAFRAGNREGMRTIQGQLTVRIREAKEKFRKKLVWKLQERS